MHWSKNKAGLYFCNFDKNDPEFKPNLKRNETNIFSIISPVYKSYSLAKKLRCEFKLGLGGIKGQLTFSLLKDAKQFTEQTLKWMRKNKDK